MIGENELLKIVKYASRAPSGHNTQPWKFILGESSVTILPDLVRALPVADNDNHELYISIGCALENLRIAADFFGYKTEVNFLNSEAETAVSIDFSEDFEGSGNELFQYIEKRQVRRNLYTGQIVPEEAIKSLREASNSNGTRAYFYTTSEEREFFKPYLMEALSLQTRSRNFTNELVSWSRFSEKEALKKGDGLWSVTLNLPNTGRLLGTFLFKRVVSVGSEIKRWKKIISHTPCFVLFTADKDEPRAWINLGEGFQRFALKATSLGLSHSHANMPCEVVSVRRKMSQQLYLRDEIPLLLIRLGYSQPMPYSFRRHLNEIIIR